MNTLASIILFTLTAAFAGATANAQSILPDAGQGPVHIISESEFDSLVDSGRLKVSSREVIWDQLQRLEQTQRKDERAVDEFIRRHTDLTAFAQMAKATPTDPKVFRTFDGSYRWAFTNEDGTAHVIETMGQGPKLAALVRSIQTSSDPAKQLALYTTLYSKYTALYDQLCSATPLAPPPKGCANLAPGSSLANPGDLLEATIDVIQSALGKLGSQAPSLLQVVPAPIITKVPGCDAEIGASVAADNIVFGDQTGRACNASTPSAGGILGNFNWLNKNQLSCIKNQGTRGVCHIFAATSAVEQLIARDTGKIVNLSEQDFTEHEKLMWGPAFFHDGGDSYDDLKNAADFGYRFAYENQWDYNPSLLQPLPPAYEFINSCNNYPLAEPGCSDSTPQAPLYCTPDYTQCGFTPVALSDANSPYGSPGPGTDVWNPKNTALSVNYIQLALAFNSAVILGFNVTQEFQSAPGGYIPFDLSDLGTSIGGHVVHVVGFVSNADLAANSGTAGAPPGSGGGYFIIKNSWGACVGDAGYYYMPVSYLEREAGEVLVVP